MRLMLVESGTRNMHLGQHGADLRSVGHLGC